MCICNLATTAWLQELLAAFVASRSKGSADEESDSPPPDLPPKKSSSHPQRPQLQPVPPQQQSSSETRPILSVDRETGIIAVDQMWTCSKCSFAYNKNAADKCDICTSSRLDRKGVGKHGNSLDAGLTQPM